MDGALRFGYVGCCIVEGLILNKIFIDDDSVTKPISGVASP